MREEMLQLAAERDLDFGIVIRKVANPATTERLLAELDWPRPPSGDEGVIEGVVEAVKVYRDGREERLGPIQLTGVDVGSFRDIVGASETTTVYSTRLRSSTGAAALGTGGITAAVVGPPIVSMAVPDLLFEELTVTAPRGSVPKLPVLPPP